MRTDTFFLLMRIIIINCRFPLKRNLSMSQLLRIRKLPPGPSDGIFPLMLVCCHAFQWSLITQIYALFSIGSDTQANNYSGKTSFWSYVVTCRHWLLHHSLSMQDKAPQTEYLHQFSKTKAYNEITSYPSAIQDRCHILR